MSDKPLTEKQVKQIFSAVDTVESRKLHGKECECPICRPDILENRPREKNDE